MTLKRSGLHGPDLFFMITSAPQYEIGESAQHLPAAKLRIDGVLAKPN